MKGGVPANYVGYWIDVHKRRVGLSESRAAWITNWIARTTSSGKVVMEEMRSVLGRMGFGLQALNLFLPFLGPIHAWVAAAPSHLVINLPELIHLILKFIREALMQGFRMAPMVLGEPAEPALCADAPADSNDVMVSCWAPDRSNDTMKAKRFS